MSIFHERIREKETKWEKFRPETANGEHTLKRQNEQLFQSDPVAKPWVPTVSEASLADSFTSSSPNSDASESQQAQTIESSTKTSFSPAEGITVSSFNPKVSPQKTTIYRKMVIQNNNRLTKRQLQLCHRILRTPQMLLHQMNQTEMTRQWVFFIIS